MEVVKHREWFIIEDPKTEKTYKMIFKDYGFSYSAVSIKEIKKIKRPEYFFFGKEIDDTKETWIIYDHHEFYNRITIDRKETYPVEYAKSIFNSIMDEKLNNKVVNRIEL
jgi:hypothetical protein